MLYLLSTWQNEKTEDGDANSESMTVGQVDAIGGFGAIINLETLRDNYKSLGWTLAHGKDFEALTVVHELGHCFTLVHPDGNGAGGTVTGLMTSNSWDYTVKKFSDKSLGKIRDVVSP